MMLGVGKAAPTQFSASLRIYGALAPSRLRRVPDRSDSYIHSKKAAKAAFFIPCPDYTLTQPPFCLKIV